MKQGLVRLSELRRSPRPALLALLAAILLLTCAAFIWMRHSASVDARPALWQIEKQGRRGWLFGTIHAVPHDARWLSPAIARATDEADWLWLEVTGLETERRDPAIFNRLGQGTGLPPVAARLPAETRARLHTLIQQDPFFAHGLDGYKSWAAALLVNARGSAASGFSARNAGEAVLSRQFARAGKPQAGLETIAGQLGLFDRLTPADQTALLAQAIDEADDSQHLLAQAYGQWARGDMTALTRQFDKSLGQRPTLQAALVETRNARWAAQIDSVVMRHRAAPFIAVGAGHLVGPRSVQAYLEARGWTVRRVQ